MFTRLAITLVILGAVLTPAHGQAKPRGLEHPEVSTKDDPAKPAGRTYALLVGVSHYRNDPPITSLQFAHKDAETFAAFLKTPLGGALGDDDMRLLTNDQATRAAVD